MSLVLTLALYGAAVVCIVGMTWRVWVWAATPEPFQIPTTSGQQPSVAGIAASAVESPSTRLGVVGRMALEGLLFRSLFRNTAFAPPPPGSPGHASPIFRERKALWLGAMALHWSLLVIVARHLRLFVEPVPVLVSALTAVDGFFDIGLPRWYATDAIVVGALAYLLARRLRDPLLRYITLPADYLALAVLSAIVGTGLVLRYVVRTDIVATRHWTLSLAAGHPAPLPDAVAWVALHVASVACLLAVLPFSKMVHGVGVWLSPTRNQANDSRRRRHVNPWNAPVPLHTHAAWQEEFRDKLKIAGLPVDDDPPDSAGRT
ncbi:MAG: sulfate reduction electron transfer complex DsrMKJOP subunit DsrM [Acidobacteria bacterium]|nr:sulfate reduction electron transfer complex DsrMKJOP subunit DsrM [Acidobacteriota bacterium]